MDEHKIRGNGDPESSLTRGAFFEWVDEKCEPRLDTLEQSVVGIVGELEKGSSRFSALDSAVDNVKSQLGIGYKIVIPILVGMFMMIVAVIVMVCNIMLSIK